MATLVIVKYLCYYCNGFPVFPERKQVPCMCDCKKMAIPGDDPDSPPADEVDRVETYSGYRLHERPRHFTFQGERLEVRRVLARWQEPGTLSFLVTSNDSRHYLLQYQEGLDTWEVRLWRGPEPSHA